ncbi:MAG: HEAT repeat domain-containing protein [Candidatus Zixiibacteriota bacterium]
MIIKPKNVIWALSAFVLLSLTSSVMAQSGFEKKVESLFVIASSGEVKYRDMVQPAIDSIASMGVDAVPILVEKFTTKSARERLTIINILKKIGSPAVPYLIKSLRNPVGLVVQRVCWALGDIADTSAVEALITVTGHQRWQVRDQALGALGDIADRRAIEVVISGFTDSIGQVRKAASVAAGKIGINNAVEQLVHILGDEFYGARMSALEALLKMDTVLVINTLADSMSSGNPFVGSLACYILGEIGSDRAVEILLEQTKNANPAQRAHAAIAIMKADPKNNCGFQDTILLNENDRLTRLKIESAITATENAR